MSPDKRTRRRRVRGEKGYILAMTGMLLVPLVVFTAFGVDLGAWYAQSAKQQRAVDAASLAGVVQLPDKTAAADAARTSLIANGFVFSNPQCSVQPDGTVATSANPCVFTFPNAAGQEMGVSIWQTATQYFSGIALKGESLARSATAVYNLHIPLGNPNNTAGNDPTRSGAQPNLWAAINGPYSNHADGDAYSTHCAGSATGATTCDSSGANNATYRTSGFLWAVDVPAADVGLPVTVQIYDPALEGGNTSPLYETSSNGGFSTSYQLFKTTGSSAATDLSAANGMNALGACTAGLGYKVFAPNGGSANAWYTLCTFTPTLAGIYPLQVKTSAIPSVPDTGGGWNAYSVKATATTQPQVYALNDMSIWTPTPSSTAKFYLANIGPQYAGHTLVIDLYDPGDGNSGDYFMTFHPPPSGLPAIVPTGSANIACKYSPPSPTIGGAATTSANPCTIQTRDSSAGTPNIYNNNWLRVQIQLPTTYSCTQPDCWWTVEYNFGSGTPTDRTVWVVNVLGDPVHLIN